MQIVLAGQRDLPETVELLRVIWGRYLPNKVVLLVDGGEGQEWLSAHMEATRLMTPVRGRTAAYVCQNFACELPVTEPTQLAELLERL
jgi:uncharacterized protein YyaL (SSP411 family)